MDSNNRAVAAIFAVFFIESAVLGNWVPRIPDLKSDLSLSDFTLGLCLLSIPLGTLSGLLVAGRIIERTGLRRACQVFLPAWALLFMLPALAPDAWMLSAALLLCGVAVGMTEVAMNTEADNIEKRVGRRIMSRCHGFWSLGSMVGALMGGLLGQLGASVPLHFLGVMPVLAIAGFVAASMLPQTHSLHSSTGTHEQQQSAPLFRLPSAAILLLCILPLGAMVVEGAFIDWSGVFMRTVMDASPLLISITYSFFSVVMAATRMFGDSLASRYGDLLVMRVSGIAAASGIALFALAPNLPIAFLAAALSGMGVAIVYPLTISAAARRPGNSSADNVAAVTMVAFSAFLVAPPLIGFLSEWLGLRVALLLLAPLAITTAILAPEVVKRDEVDAPGRF